MIKIEQLKKSFGKVNVLTGLDLEIKEGGVFVILGPNGSGKTTLIKSLLGMVIPSGGCIEVDGENVLGKWDYRNRINYLPQIANFPNNLTINELIEMVRNLRNKDSNPTPLIELFGLTPFLNQKLSHLSGGTKQKVNIVLTFMFDSDIIILDEPTNGLDPISLIHLKELIENERLAGKTILITTHIISFVEEVANEIVFILDGKIYFKGNIPSLLEKTGESALEPAIANILKTSYA